MGVLEIEKTLPTGTLGQVSFVSVPHLVTFVPPSGLVYRSHEGTEWTSYTLCSFSLVTTAHTSTLSHTDRAMT